MSRTIKDMPFWLWQAERLGTPYPPAPHSHPWWHPEAPDGSRYSDPAVWDTWLARWPTDPAVKTQKARRKSSAGDRRLHEGRYRTYVRDRLRRGDWDGIEAPEHLTGYTWWW